MISVNGSQPEERFAKVGEVDLCWDELGDPDGEPMVMVMGLGTQLIHWHPDFCAELGERGYRVIRFDNRDAGLSTSFEGAPPARMAAMFGLRRGLAYTLDDMADDVTGLMDELGIESAHLVGISMGGMIAQMTAVRSPERIRSQALISSSSGRRVTAFPRFRAMGTLLSRPARTREAFVEVATKTFEVIGSPAYPMEEARKAEFRATLERTWDRGHNAAGFARQLHAITASGDRRRWLRGTMAPTLVMHGDKDPLVRLAAGRSLAAAIPNAKLRIIPGLGHDMPPALFGEFADAIAANGAQAAAPQPA